MDATIYEIIFGELGDLNCSLVEAFHDTLLENASLSLLSSDGKMDWFSFFFCLTAYREVLFAASWRRKRV